MMMMRYIRLVRLLMRWIWDFSMLLPWVSQTLL